MFDVNRSDRKRFDVHYRTIDTKDNDCIYCGVGAEVLDHIPPLSGFTIGMDAKKVPSCKECNRFLHSKVIIDINERKEYLIGRYRKKYWLTLKQPHWTQEELNAVAEDTRTYIRGKTRFYKYILNKLAELEEPFIND